MFNWAIHNDVLNFRNPSYRIERLPEDPFIPYVPPVQDVLKVKLVAVREERDFIETLYHTMARKSEVVRLTWEDVNFEQRWIRLFTRRRRGGELQPDYIPMNNTLHSILHRQWEHRDKETPHFFCLSADELRHMMEGLCKKAGVKPFGFHAIRHHVASAMNDSGKASMKQIQVLLRHKRQSTTETYLHTIGQGIRDAVMILDEQSSTDSTVKKTLFPMNSVSLSN